MRAPLNTPPDLGPASPRRRVEPCDDGEPGWVVRDLATGQVLGDCCGDIVYLSRVLAMVVCATGILVDVDLHYDGCDGAVGGPACPA